MNRQTQNGLEYNNVDGKAARCNFLIYNRLLPPNRLGDSGFRW